MIDSDRVCWWKRLEQRSMGAEIGVDELANGLVAGSRIRIRISREGEVGTTYMPFVLGEKQASLRCGVVHKKDGMFFDIF